MVDSHPLNRSNRMLGSGFILIRDVHRVDTDKCNTTSFCSDPLFPPSQPTLRRDSKIAAFAKAFRERELKHQLPWPRSHPKQSECSHCGVIRKSNVQAQTKHAMHARAASCRYICCVQKFQFVSLHDPSTMMSLPPFLELKIYNVNNVCKKKSGICANRCRHAWQTPASAPSFERQGQLSGDWAPPPPPPCRSCSTSRRRGRTQAALPNSAGSRRACPRTAPATCTPDTA